MRTAGWWMTTGSELMMEERRSGGTAEVEVEVEVEQRVESVRMDVCPAVCVEMLDRTQHERLSP